MSVRRLLRAVRENCRDSMGRDKGYRAMIRDCSSRQCPMWCYRLGVPAKAAAGRGENVEVERE
jgi:hypothetical protein